MLMPGRRFERRAFGKENSRDVQRRIVAAQPQESGGGPFNTRVKSITPQNYETFLCMRVVRMHMHRAVARMAAVATGRPRAAALMILAACGRVIDACIAVGAKADGTEQHHSG